MLAWAHLVYAAGQAHNENDLMGHTMTDFSPSNEMIGQLRSFLEAGGTRNDDHDHRRPGWRKERGYDEQ